ncbi:plasmid replication protein RepC [Paenochrobactrum pullorum]|uniref:plasmid replication protein RepC n=3 Tax=Paenochrobactrum TaxID=999488 RepID=UPI0035BC099B
MDVQFATTPFGGRVMSFDLLSAQHFARKSNLKDKKVDKWQLYKALCEGRSHFNISDRSLSVLSALLSFYPEISLNEESGLVVFPSNKQLSLRAHGMPDPTLRRHLAALVNAGLIIRRDSPNGKRYAHKNKQGAVQEAFGFSLAPLLVRYDEIVQAAESVAESNLKLKRTRERITLQRRDIGKLIDVALTETMSGNWEGLFNKFRAIVDALPRRATLNQLETILTELNALRTDVDKTLKLNENSKNMSGNDCQNERQHNESNTDYYIESESALEKIETEVGLNPQSQTRHPFLTLNLVLKACPEIADYAVDGIKNWRDFIKTTAQVRNYLNISTSAYQDALDQMGHEDTAIAIACILQRCNHIQSAGGYLRTLTSKARAGELSIQAMVMANINKKT